MSAPEPMSPPPAREGELGPQRRGYGETFSAFDLLKATFWPAPAPSEGPRP